MRLRHLLLPAVLLFLPLAPAAAQAPQFSFAEQTYDNILAPLPLGEILARANTGVAAAMNFLGRKYFFGDGVPQSDQKALGWFNRAADQNDPIGRNNLAVLYLLGRGVKPNPSQAVPLLEASVRSGIPAAETNLGLLYESGIGVPQDLLKASALFKRAAQQKNPIALAELARIDPDTARPIAASQQREAETAKGQQQHNEKELAAQELKRQEMLVRYNASGAQPAPTSGTTSAPLTIQANIDPDPPKTLPAHAANLTPTPANAPDQRGLSPHPQSVASPRPIRIPHNYALIFATGVYAHWPALQNPIADADALNQTLTSLYGFQVEEVQNPTDDQILAKLTEYLHRHFEPQDQLLIFFGGHGYFDTDLHKGFLVPANALPASSDLGHRSLLAHETIMGYVNRIPSRHVLLVMDACFAGTLDRRIADGALRGDPSAGAYAHATLPELLERKEPKRTRIYFASGGKDFVPDGKPGHHSPFMSALLITLNQAADRKGYVTLDDLQQGLDTVTPEPVWGPIEDENDPGADFLLLTSAAIRQLAPPR